MNNPVLISYVPHGVNHEVWKKLTTEEELAPAVELRKKMLGDDNIKFVVLYNNRNIRRKMTSDVILAYRDFLEMLPLGEQEQCRLLLHTQPIDDNGTDLFAVLRDLAPNVKAIFSPNRVSPTEMVHIYNNVDVVINLASNEGFGIGTLEAMMVERMIIANVTGGLQDQMGFVDDNGKYIHPDIHFNESWGTNAEGTFKQCGDWVIPVFPSNRSLIGSPPTPYIFDDRCSYTDAAKAIKQVYDLSPEERARRGKLGREWAMAQHVGMTSTEMCRRMMEGIDECLETWTPRERFDIFKA
jgi:glycosyltransferase involved in cell wall biosynthesis